jgi:tetratricopeptide (TPR) repeat protein
MSAGRLGGVQLARGDAAAALPVLQKAVAGLEGVVAKDPNNRGYLRFLLSHRELTGDALESLGRFAEAKEAYAKIVAESERVLPAEPEDGVISADLTEGHLKLGLVLSREGNPQAIEQINLALNQNQKFREAHPEQVLVKLRWARCLGGRALAAYRLANRPGVASAERDQQLRQARQDVAQADQIVAALPAQRPGLVVSRSLALIAEARKALADPR